MFIVFEVHVYASHSEIRTALEDRKSNKHVIRSLETINKQSSNCTNSSHKPNDNSDRRQAPADSFSGVNIISSKPLLRRLTLRAGVCIRLRRKNQKLVSMLIKPTLANIIYQEHQVSSHMI